MVNSSNGVENHVLPEVLGNRDVYEMQIDMPSPNHSHFVASTSPLSFVHVARNSTEGNNNGVSNNSQGS